MPPKARPLDTDRALILYNQGKTWQEVADALGVARTTLLSRLRSLGPLPQRTDIPEAPATGTPESPPDIHTLGTLESTPEVHNQREETPISSIQAGVPDVYNGIPEGMLADLAAMVRWWRERQAALQARSTASKPTRVTFHVEPLWVDMIRRQADLDKRTITEVVNEAFRAYFER